MLDGLLLGLRSHRDHALCQPQIDVILQRQARADRLGEARDDLLDQCGALETNVYPLRQVSCKARRILLFRIE